LVHLLREHISGDLKFGKGSKSKLYGRSNMIV
jgi:hypothetical protein